MTCHLPVDCLNEIFEYLEEDKITLRSCLLVNHLWCGVSVRILWRDIWSFKYSVAYELRFKIASAILGTLIACLPNESRELLYENGIVISTPTSKPPLFNYGAFCKVLPIYEIGRIIDEVFEKGQPPVISLNLKDGIYLVAEEIIKMFMKQISSLKKLTYYTSYLNTSFIDVPFNISFTGFPGARDCLTNLSELRCSSKIHSEFFHELSQICHNLQSFIIEFESDVSDELKELISSQNNLKHLSLIAYDENNWTDILPALTKHSNTITKLHLHGDSDFLPLAFASSFSNIQEINFSFIEGMDGRYFDNFKELQCVPFPNLRTLKFPYQSPKTEYVIKFLEVNGKYLEEFYTYERDNTLNLSIAKLCLNIRKLFVVFNSNELDILKNIFDSCQYLESIKVLCGGEELLNEKEVLEVVAKHSPKNFYELRIYNDSHSELTPEDLESFFICWKNRTPKKSLCLIIIKDYYYNSLEMNKENKKLIEKYKNLGTIKEFVTKEFDYEDEEEKT